MSPPGTRPLPPRGGAGVRDEAWVPRWERGFAAVYGLLSANLKEPGRRLWRRFPRRFAQPAPTYRWSIYLWDSAFISLIWSDWRPAIAREIILSVIDGQQPDGRIPHVVNLQGVSEWSNPPLLAWAGVELLKRPEREASREELVEFAQTLYRSTRAFSRWLDRERRHESTGLYFWAHPYESGLDNSPRFSSRDEKKFDNTRTLLAVDLAAYVALQFEALEWLATYLGLDGDAQDWRERQATLARAINTWLWNPATELYQDRRLVPGARWVEIDSIASYFVLATRAVPEDRRELLLNRLAQPAKYNTLIPLPSVARDDPSYEPDCWRGPVWINTAHLTLEGIRRYRPSLARAQAWRIIDGVYGTYEREGEIGEFYDPDRWDWSGLTRKLGNVFKQILPGAKPVKRFVGWTGLVNHWVAREFDGAHAGRYRLRVLPSVSPIATP